VAADLEGQRRTVGVPDIDSLAVLDVDIRHAPVVDEHAVEAAVVDREPSALVESHDQVCSGDEGVPDTDVCPQVTPDDDVVACCEGALRCVIPHGQHRWGCCAHGHQLYRE
jgi:hypothetical protein